MMTQAVAPGYGGGYTVPSSGQNQASALPVAALVLTGTAIGVLGLAAIISADDRSSPSRQQTGGRCYQEAVERLFENCLTYTEKELRETLFELTVRKFQQEGSGSHWRPLLRAGLSRSEVEPAARKSTLKFLRCGLSSRKMERFLNEHVRRLREMSPPSQWASLRDFDRHETKCQDLSTISASKLFPCEEVKRYIVLSFQKVDKVRDPRKGDPAHFDAIVHNGKAWVVANNPPELLVEASATPEGAKRALDMFTRSKYGGLTRNGVTTIFSERRA